MANKLLISVISLSFVFLLHSCIARNEWQQQGECQLQRINALQPTDRLQSEGGQIEFWNSNDQEFQCAGVAVMRTTIRRRGLLLPAYTNSPVLVFVERGRGLLGTLFPSCPETYESSQQGTGRQEQEQGQGRGEGQRSKDRHQKIRAIRQGDVVAVPTGVARWVYNSGEEDLVAIVMLDTSNTENQLDTNPRRFFIAGNPQGQQQQHGQRGEGQQHHGQQGQGQHHGQQGQGQQQHHGQQGQGHHRHWGNVLQGFDVQVLREAFNIDEETARRLQGVNDNRGPIIRVENGLQVTTPPEEESQRGQGRGQGQGQGQGRGNGLEETICSARLRENLDDPERADVFNPNAGRLSTLNSFNLPILSFLKLSAERGFLRQNALMAPHWNLNAHSVIYVTRGNARIQIVDNRGRSVFNEQVQQGQILVVPQNFAVVKRAGNEGFHWIAFKTNDNAMVSTLAGRTSAFRGLPADVLANAYQISREEAQRLKNSRQETLLFSPQHRSPRGGSNFEMIEEVVMGV